MLYQAQCLAGDLTLLGDEASAARALALAQQIADSDVDELLRPSVLSVTLASLEQDFRRLSSDMAARHFVRQAPRRAQTSGWGSQWQVTDGR